MNPMPPTLAQGIQDKIGAFIHTGPRNNGDLVSKRRGGLNRPEVLRGGALQRVTPLRVLTGYNKDSDVFLAGIGYRF